MQYLGIHYEMKHAPKLDPGFIPFGVWMQAYLKGADKPLAIAVERMGGHITVRHTFIHGTPEMAEADYRYVERIVSLQLRLKHLLILEEDHHIQVFLFFEVYHHS